MYYEINVSFGGRHLFATAERSCQSELQFATVLGFLKDKFPKSEGFQITATKIDEVGTDIPVYRTKKDEAEEASLRG